jgi:hypothetical protein
MSKLSLTCACGQDMLVPASALHRVGLCPSCGVEIAISEGNTRPYEPPRPTGGRLLSLQHQQRATPRDPDQQEQSWRRFAEAVDLYNDRHYAEALTLLNALQEEFPGNPHVQAAREQCLRALQRSATALQVYDGQQIEDIRLSPELVKSVVLEKMLHSKDEAVQLQAAQLAAHLLGMFSPAPTPAPAGPLADSPPPPPDIVLQTPQAPLASGGRTQRRDRNKSRSKPAGKKSPRRGKS